MPEAAVLKAASVIQKLNRDIDSRKKAERSLQNHCAEELKQSGKSTLGTAEEQVMPRESHICALDGENNYSSIIENFVLHE